MKHQHIGRPTTRREALRTMGAGFGMVGLAGMIGQTIQVASGASTNPWTPRPPHFPARAKHVIFIFLNGGLSHVDSFDYKPALKKYDGKPLPYETPRTEFATGNLMDTPFQFQQYGENGTLVSELFPNIAGAVDEFCIIRSMQSDIPNHVPGVLMANTGFSQRGRPSMGSWIVYGLGTENQNLPGFIVLSVNGRGEDGGRNASTAAFLPAVYQGTPLSLQAGDPKKMIQYLSNANMGQEKQREQLELIQNLNRLHLERTPGSPQLEATIQTMETAFRMQMEAPNVLDIGKESEATRKLYGDSAFSRACLMARRMVERGVRFIQLNHGDWDHHADIMRHRNLSLEVDGPITTLLKDLKQRGLLDETLIIVGTEFGRTPVVQLASALHNGRDHNVHGFTWLLAGGGIRGGTIYGSTDEFGFKVAENPVHIHDVHATILHLLGMDHEKLTYRYSGRDFRLTDVEGRVVNEIIA